MNDSYLFENEDNALKYSQSVLHEIFVINTILNNSNDTIYFKDLQSRFILSSNAHSEIFNIDDHNEVIGKTDFDFFPESFAQAALKDEQNIIDTGIPMIGKIEKLQKPNGEVQWFSASKYPLYDPDGNIIGTWGTSRDVTKMKLFEEELERVNEQLKEANRQLEILSSKDSLSGLYNHRHFYEEMKRLFELFVRNKKKGKSLTSSIIVFDIDFFKNINDTYGHMIGDYAIKHVADMLVDSIRSTDTAFRYGGDEFVILLVDTTANEAKITGDKIRKKLSQKPLIHGKSRVNFSISGGVSNFDEVNNVNELLELADKRLYKSKSNGRNMIS